MPENEKPPAMRVDIYCVDFNASLLQNGVRMNEFADDFLKYICDVASGEKTRNKINGYREISILKDGIVL